VLGGVQFEAATAIACLRFCVCLCVRAVYDEWRMEIASLACNLSLLATVKAPQSIRTTEEEEERRD
jgi:hypothetical protein